MRAQEPLGSGFTRDTTWMEVIEGRDLTSKLAVITGGSVGLGLHTAMALGKAGADLVLGARSIDALRDAKQGLEQAGVRNVYVAPLDLCSPSAVVGFAKTVRALERPVDLLIANAGVMAAPLSRDDRGNEFQFSTNYLGHALLASQLAQGLAAAESGRVVSLSSTGHHFGAVDLDDPNFERRPYDKWDSYGQSKSASSLLAVKLANDLGQAGVTAFAVHPGMIPTDLGKYLTPDDYVANTARLGKFAETLPAFKTLESGAATTVWAATSPALAGRSFAYCEDCDIARPIESANYAWGVLPYATDETIADRLWAKAEQLVGQSLPLLA